MQINSKTMSRVLAIQALYQYDFYLHQNNSNNKNIDNIINDVLHLYRNYFVDTLNLSTNLKPIIKKLYYEQLVHTTINNIDTIDTLYSSYLKTNYNTNTLNKVLLCILRVAVCELQFFINTPFKVIVDEYTNIANALEDQTHVGFINSVIDNISKQISRI